MAVRMTGLISGLDTESLVKEMVSASSSKVDKVKQEKQLLEWKKEAWSSLNTKIYNFYKSEVSSLRLTSSFKSKKAAVSDETKVSIDAGTNAPDGTHSVSVKQLASSAYLTGTNIKSTGSSYTSYEKASGSTRFADMTDASGNSLGLEGKTITVSAGNDLYNDLTLQLGGTGDNSVATLDELNARLKEAGYDKLQAGFVDGQIVFTNSSATQDADGNTMGEIFHVESEALGLSGDISYKTEEDTGASTTLSGISDIRYVNNFTSSDITSSTKLTALGIKVGTSFGISGKEFVVDENTTISSLVSGLSKMGVSANYDANQGRIYINASSTGADYDFNLTSTDETALDILGLSTSAGATKVSAQDAVIEYNGVEYTGSSNTFDLNGLSITAKGVTGTYDKTTGTFTNDSPVNITVGADVDGVYDTIKNFVKKYNELIEEMNTLYNEEKTDYDPLTDDERSELSDTQIEQWEKKAKQGILRRDETISSLLSSMRTILNKAVTVTDKDGNEKQYTLSSLGIVTGDYSENGKLHIMGDEDDAEYASETNKLKAALSSNPEIFSQLFVGDKENQGLGSQLYSSLTKAMARTESSHSLTFYNDITLDDQIDDKEDEIDKWEEKLQDLEDKYYDQFAAMETAMAKLQSQQSYISSLMGS